MTNSHDHSLAEQEFQALVAIDRDADDLHLEPGDEFKGSLFPLSVLQNWLGLQPEPAIRDFAELTRSGVLNAVGESLGRLLIDAGISTESAIPRHREELIEIPGIGPAKADQILTILGLGEDDS